MEKKEVKKWQDEEALKRYQMIAPLLDPDMDEGKRQQLREKAAEKNGISKRTLYRYEKGCREEGFDGLRPASRTKHRQQGLPENFGEIMEQAVQLRREVPKRSVRQIIKVLELEGWAQPGVLKQSTMQRHLYDAGLGKKQMKRYAEKREASSRRFCRPHRMELLQGDIKYGPDLRTTSGELVKTYLSSLIDDHSRYIVQSEFYDSQRQEIVEDTFHKAVLKAGKFDCAYLDNGVQYTAGHLGRACAKLGIRIIHAKPGACQSKGRIEKFHQKVDQFTAEIHVAHVHSVEELNRRWKILKERMEKFGLELEESKSRMLESGGYLAKSKQKRGESTRLETFDFLGFTFYCGQTRKGTAWMMPKTSSKKFRQKLKDIKVWLYANRDQKLKKLMGMLNLKLTGHYRYYGVSFNGRMISNFKQQVREMLFKVLNRRSNRKSYTREGFIEMLKYYPLVMPKIYVSLF